MLVRLPAPVLLIAASSVLSFALTATAQGQCGVTDDALEPNDSCGARASIGLGFLPGLVVEEGDPDWYEIVVPDGERISIEAIYPPPFGFGTAIALEVRDPSISCDFVAAAQLAEQRTPTPTGTQLEWSNLTGAPKAIAVGVVVRDDADEDCYEYDLRLTTAVDACAPFADDVLEPNDRCFSPRALSPGFYGGLQVALEDPDLYAVDVPAGARLLVDVLSSPGFSGNAVFLWDDVATCVGYVAANAIANSGDTGASQTLAWLNDSALERTVLLEVRHPRFGPAPFCTDYSMLVRLGADVCYLEDPLDDNDTCDTRKPLSDGRYPGLRVRADDPDFYEVRIPPGRTFTASLTFDGALADINATLVDPATQPCEFDPFGSYLALAFGLGDRETIQYTNTGATELTATLLVVMSPLLGQPDPRCMTYRMAVQGSSVPETPIGRAFCDPTPNAGGTPSFLDVDRIPVLGDPDLRLEVTGLEPGAFGYLVMSPFVGAGQVVGAGNLCMDAPYYRLASSIVAADPSGQVSVGLPWGSMPVLVAPGSTWAFQHWHRDRIAGGASTTNFSSGLEVVFQL